MKKKVFFEGLIIGLACGSFCCMFVLLEVKTLL